MAHTHAHAHTAGVDEKMAFKPDSIEGLQEEEQEQQQQQQQKRAATPPNTRPYVPLAVFHRHHAPIDGNILAYMVPAERLQRGKLLVSWFAVHAVYSGQPLFARKHQAWL